MHAKLEATSKEVASLSLDEGDLKKNKEMLKFYIGFHSWEVLMVVFNLVSLDLNSANSELSKFTHNLMFF